MTPTTKKRDSLGFSEAQQLLRDPWLVIRRAPWAPDRYVAGIDYLSMLPPPLSREDYAATDWELWDTGL